MKKVLEILKYSYSSETNRHGQFETYRKEHIQEAIEKLKKAIAIAYMTIASLLISFFIMFYICYDYSHQVDKLEKDKSELQSKLNIKNVELDIAKRDLTEAHEILGVVFLEAMSVTDSYNKLKQQKCKKGK